MPPRNKLSLYPLQETGRLLMQTARLGALKNLQSLPLQAAPCSCAGVYPVAAKRSGGTGVDMIFVTDS